MSTGSLGYFECYNHRVTFNEVDPYGIVHHSIYLIWAELGMQKLLEESGTFDKYEIKNISCKYLSSAHDHDEITVRTKIKSTLPKKDDEFAFPFDIIAGRRVLVKGEITFKKEESL